MNIGKSWEKYLQDKIDNGEIPDEKGNYVYKRKEEKKNEIHQNERRNIHTYYQR